MSMLDLRAGPGEWQEYRHDSGEVLGFRFLRSARRSIAIYVNRDGTVLVRAPQRAPFAEVCFFLAERWEWLQHHRSRFLREAPPRTLLFRDGEPILHLGEELVLRLRESSRSRAVRMGGELHLAVPAHADADNSGVIAAVESWQRREALRLFPERLAHCHGCMREQLNLPLPQLRVRKMRSRWGSCSRAAVVTLNLELIRMPLECIDYVITHELCHLVEFNHSPRFYELQARFVPDWKERKRHLEMLGRR